MKTRGINAIRCEGLYAEVKESGAGKGYRSSSDFNGSEMLKGAAIVALMAAGTFAAGCVGKDSEPQKPEQQYRFRRFGDTKTIHDEATNKTYELEFDGLKERWSYAKFYEAAHFNVYDVSGQGKMKIGDIELTPHSSLFDDMTLPGTRMDLSAEIGKGYVDLKVTEQ